MLKMDKARSPCGLRAVSTNAGYEADSLLAALVRDLPGTAVTASDHLLLLHALVRDDVERVALDALLLELGVDLGLEILARLSLGRRLGLRIVGGRLRLYLCLCLCETERRREHERCEHHQVFHRDLPSWFVGK